MLIGTNAQIAEYLNKERAKVLLAIRSRLLAPASLEGCDHVMLGLEIAVTHTRRVFEEVAALRDAQLQMARDFAEELELRKSTATQLNALFDTISLLDSVAVSLNARLQQLVLLAVEKQIDAAPLQECVLRLQDFRNAPAFVDCLRSPLWTQVDVAVREFCNRAGVDASFLPSIAAVRLRDVDFVSNSLDVLLHRLRDFGSVPAMPQSDAHIGNVKRVIVIALLLVAVLGVGFWWQMRRRS